jgi:sugar phosphate isomerase/epimerase
MTYTRRQILAGMGAVGLGTALSLWGTKMGAALPATTAHDRMKVGPYPFRIAVISDEITQDFEKACQIISRDFGLHWIELRTMWDKNMVDLKEKEQQEARKILQEHKLRVTDIASPLFKTEWPGARRAPQGEKQDQFGAHFDAQSQDELLDRCISLAKVFHTDRIRCFDYSRLEDPKPYRAEINKKLQQAAERCAQDKIVLLLENEMSCNTATGEEAAAVLKAVPHKNFMLNWDPGNAAASASTPYPTGYEFIPKGRIGHCHCKDVMRTSNHQPDWAPVGGGMVDWVGQLRALRRDGFHYGLSLETHWRGAGTPEASTRISMEGLQKALRAALP